MSFSSGALCLRGTLSPPATHSTAQNVDAAAEWARPPGRIPRGRKWWWGSSAGCWTGPSGPSAVAEPVTEPTTEEFPEHLTIAMANWRRGLIEPWFNDLAARETLIKNANAKNGQEQLQKTRTESLLLYHPDKLSGYDMDKKERH